jgi:hypothetical protein
LANIDLPLARSIIGLFAGLLLGAWGLYLRRHGRLRNRQGAAVLAGFAAALGFLVMGVGFLFFVWALRT